MKILFLFAIIGHIGDKRNMKNIRDKLSEKQFRLMQYYLENALDNIKKGLAYVAFEYVMKFITAFFRYQHTLKYINKKDDED